MFKITTDDRLGYQKKKKKNCVRFVWLIVNVLNVIHCVQLLNRHKTKNKVRQEFYTCTNMKESTHADTRTTTLRLNAYFCSHYADLKEMKKVLQFYLCYHTLHTQHTIQE